MTQTRADNNIHTPLKTLQSQKSERKWQTNDTSLRDNPARLFDEAAKLLNQNYFNNDHKFRQDLAQLLIGVCSQRTCGQISNCFMCMFVWERTKKKTLVFHDLLKQRNTLLIKELTNQLLVPIDFCSVKTILWKSMGTSNWLVNSFINNVYLFSKLWPCCTYLFLYFRNWWQCCTNYFPYFI